MKIYTIEQANSEDLIIIAKHFLDSDLSLRSFANLYCHFSYITLRDKFLKILPNFNYFLYKKIVEKLQTKKTKNINSDSEGIKRVLKAVVMLLEEDLTVVEIADALNSTEMTIYRDLTVRLMQIEDIDINLKKQVLERLQEHSRANLAKKGR